MLFTWLMLASLILFLVPQNLTSSFQLAFARVFRVPLSFSRAVLLSSRVNNSPDYMNQRQQSRYRNHIANLQEKLRQEQQKVHLLSGLRKAVPIKDAEYVIADIIRAQLDGSTRQLTINCGQDDGLKVGQFVLGDNSIIGTVTDVSSRIAQVKLITDPSSNIEIKTASLNIFALMQGDGNGFARICTVPVKYNLKVGKTIYARKKPGFLDAPVIVGHVLERKRADANPLLWEITVKPACDMENLDTVVVIMMNHQQ
jgi:rod shape-determining protein MreC